MNDFTVSRSMFILARIGCCTGIANSGCIFHILIYVYIQQYATLHSLFYLGTDLHISGGTIAHH